MSTAPTRRGRTRLLQSLRLRMLRNTAGVAAHRSLLRLLTVLLCCALIWGTLFAISYVGFRELRQQWGFTLDEQMIGVVFNLAFVALSFLLLFSTGIILYSSLFGSRESAFLLVTPLPADQIFAYKFQGAVGFSSWAFVLLGSPILLAYGLHVGGGAPWYFYLIVPLYFFGFILVPGSIGALLCLLVVNYFPRRRWHFLAALGALAVLAAAWWGLFRLLPSARRLLVSNDALEQFFAEFSVFRSPFLPASWMAEGIRVTALGQLTDSLYYLALLWSNGLLLYTGTALAARLLYRRGYNLLISSGAVRRRYGSTWLDRLVAALLWPLAPQTRTLVLKDFRTFRRDPAQWGQIVIFAGLATLYFLNIRGFYRQDIGRPFQNGISLLNLVATGLLICAYNGRFIYPMLSLEGNKFWILGLLPLERKRLVWGKFFYAAVGTLVLGEFLVNLSNWMLNVPWSLMLLHALVIAVLALGLSGLSVGMGATIPNFRETDPSKIAVGFGGTVNLILGLLYQVLVLVLMALPWHLLAAAAAGHEDHLALPPWLWVGVGGGVVLGAAAVVVPLRSGAKALQKMEF